MKRTLDFAVFRLTRPYNRERLNDKKNQYAVWVQKHGMFDIQPIGKIHEKLPQIIAHHADMSISEFIKNEHDGFTCFQEQDEEILFDIEAVILSRLGLTGQVTLNHKAVMLAQKMVITTRSEHLPNGLQKNTIVKHIPTGSYVQSDRVKLSNLQLILDVVNDNSLMRGICNKENFCEFQEKGKEF